MELIRELNAGDVLAPKIPNPDERVGYPIDRLPSRKSRVSRDFSICSNVSWWIPYTALYAHFCVLANKPWSRNNCCIR